MNIDEDLPKWTINSSKYIVNDKYIRLRVDSCTTPNGAIVEPYYVLEYGDWVNCLAIDTDMNVVMLKHYRHGVQKYLPELIGGGIEPTDESPEAAARRELEEEAGYTGGRLYGVGVSYPNPANHTNKVHSFFAIGGSVTKQQNLEAGETILVEKVPFSDVLEHMRAPGALYQSMYIATMFYVLNFIRTSSDPALQPLKKLV